jgi:ADP-ribose pyrophosphatase
MNNDNKTVFETEWFSVEQRYFDHIQSLKGKPYYTICSPDGVIILALTHDGKIILVRQFRPSLNQYTLEVPSGAIDSTETPQEAAARELYEETGYRCEHLSCIGRGRIMLSRLSAYEFAFYGTGAVQDPTFQPQEDIQVVLVTPTEFRHLVTSGEFEQFAMLGLLVLADWRLGSVLRQF